MTVLSFWGVASLMFDSFSESLVHKTGFANKWSMEGSPVVTMISVLKCSNFGWFGGGKTIFQETSKFFNLQKKNTLFNHQMDVSKISQIPKSMKTRSVSRHTNGHLRKVSSSIFRHTQISYQVDDISHYIYILLYPITSHYISLIPIIIIIFQS